MSKQKKNLGKVAKFVAAETLAIFASIGTLAYMSDRGWSFQNNHTTRNTPIVVDVNNQYVVDEKPIDNTSTSDILQALKDVEPIEVEQRGNSTYYTYLSEDIAAVLDQPCVQDHFILTYDEFMEINKDTLGSIRFNRSSSNEFNQVTVFTSSTSDYTSTHTYFHTTVGQSNNDIAYDIDYDSVTGEIHSITIYTGHYGDTFKQCAEAIMSDTFDGYHLQTDFDTLMQKYKKSSDSYEETFGGINVRVYAMNDYMSLTFSPAYRH